MFFKKRDFSLSFCVHIGEVPLCTVMLLVITQIGLAVGDTEQERQKAEFTKLKAWVGILN